MNQIQDIENLSVDQLVDGFTTEDDRYTCIYCGAEFERGVIHQMNERLYEAPRAITLHIEVAHEGTIAALLSIPKEKSGLTDVQHNLIGSLAAGESDRDIARATQRAESTVRNQRFQLRRKVLEAKVILALSQLLEDVQQPGSRFVKYHADIPDADDRIVTTRDEERKIIERYAEGDGPEFKLSRYPKKQKEWLVILKHVTARFEAERTYSESEVNEVLKPVFDDYVTLRRYLIEYRFLERAPGGAAYWLHAE